MTVLSGTLLAIQMQVAAAAPPAVHPVPTGSSVQATRTAVAPVLDGRDDDAVWRSAPADRPVPRGQAHRGRAAEVPDRGPGRLRRAQPVRLRPRLRSPPRQHHEPALPPRRPDRVGLRHPHARPLPRPAHRATSSRSTPPASRPTTPSTTTATRTWPGTRCGTPRPGSTRSAGPPSTAFRSRSSTTRPRASGTFGLLIWRVIQRHTATVTWPLYRSLALGLHVAVRRASPGSTAWAARAARRSRPYVVTKNVPGRSAPADFDRSQDVSVGGDLKYRPRLEPAAQRDGQPGLRPGRGRSRRSSTSARSRPSSTSGGRSSWKGRGCSPSR